jgi:hypothetical protein
MLHSFLLVAVLPGLTWAAQDSRPAPSGGAEAPAAASEAAADTAPPEEAAAEPAAQDAEPAAQGGEPAQDAEPAASNTAEETEPETASPEEPVAAEVVAPPPAEPEAAGFLSVDDWAPVDPGGRGWFIGGGGGLVVGIGRDEDGESTGTFIGSGGYLRFGEEVFERFTLGLMFYGAGGSGGGDEPYSTGFGGFFLQATIRPFEVVDPLLILLSTGIGGGSITADTEGEGPEGAVGGALYQVGLAYEFELSRNSGGGWRLGPALTWTLVPPVGDNDTLISNIVVGVESTWYAGR